MDRLTKCCSNFAEGPELELNLQKKVDKKMARILEDEERKVNNLRNE